MKRVCAMICLTMLIVAQTLNINVKASVIVPEIPLDPGLISGLGDLGYGLAGGASFDFTGSKWAKLEQELENGGATRTEALQQASLAFLSDYSARRGVPYAEQLPDMPVTAKDYYYTNYYNSAVRKSWELYKIGVANENQANINRALLFPLSPDRFADWTNYNAFWYEKYLASLEDAGSDVVVPTPDEVYIPYITTINNRIPQSTPYGTSFYWASNMYFNESWTYYRGDTIFTPTNSFPESFSWIVENVNVAQISTYSNGIYSSPPLIGYDIFDVYINNVNGSYQLTTSTLVQSFYYSRPIYGNKNAFGLRYDPTTNNLTFQSSTDYRSGINSFTYSGTLSECFDYLARKVKNVNIYVDGECWAYVGGIDDAPANPVIPDFPDVIGGTSDDPLPAYDIVMPGTADHSGYFDITALFDEIMIAISGATDDDDSTDAILDKDAIKENLKDEALDDVPDDVIPSDEVIDEPLEGVATMRLPEIPIYPAPAVNALAGTTILASYIDAMNQLLPNNIIVVFWGIVWVLLIVAIIKSMHR